MLTFQPPDLPARMKRSHSLVSMVCGIIFGGQKSSTRTARIYQTQRLLAAEEAADKRDVARATSALLLLLVTTEQAA